MVEGVTGKRQGPLVPKNIVTIKGASIPRALQGFAVRFATPTMFINSEKIELLENCLEKFNKRCENKDFLSAIAKSLKAKGVQNVLIVFSFAEKCFSMTVIGFKDGSPAFKAVFVLN